MRTNRLRRITASWLASERQRRGAQNLLLVCTWWQHDCFQRGSDAQVLRVPNLEAITITRKTHHVSKDTEILDVKAISYISKASLSLAGTSHEAMNNEVLFIIPPLRHLL